MATFTVKGAMATGKQDPKFGTEFYVQLNEMADTAKLWFKQAPEVGSTLELEQSKYGWKKVKKEWNPNGPAPTQQATGAPAQSSGRSYKDNSDGMRQGMCINNAANYVNSLEFPKALTDREWAVLVHDYASALYVLGDLKAPEAKEAESVGEIFNAD